MEKEDLMQEFLAKIVDGIQQFNDAYHFNANTEVSGLTPNRLLLSFLSYFRSLNLEHKLYIIIDEYDNFTNAILEGTGEKFKGAVGKSGFIKAFYAIIKEYCGLGIVGRVFITGICPISLDSMTSGFNIARDISDDIRFHSMIGLTHGEVKDLLQDIEKEKREEIFDIMKKTMMVIYFIIVLKKKIFLMTLLLLKFQIM